MIGLASQFFGQQPSGWDRPLCPPPRIHPCERLVFGMIYYMSSGTLLSEVKQDEPPFVPLNSASRLQQHSLGLNSVDGASLTRSLYPIKGPHYLMIDYRDTNFTHYYTIYLFNIKFLHKVHKVNDKKE